MPLRTNLTFPVIALLGALAWLMSPRAVRAETRHFVVIFAAQFPEANVSRDSHNFAVFVETNGRAVPGERRESIARVVTISWLPRTLSICLACRDPEPGINLSLGETLAWEKRKGLRVSRWGPFRISAPFFASAVRQSARLASGRAFYILNDRDTRPQAFNCIHAVTDVVVPLGAAPLRIGATWGDPAGALMVGYLRPWMEAARERDEWIAQELGLDAARVVRRTR